MQFVGGSKYSLYDLYGGLDRDLLRAINNVVITGTIKNNSSCEVKNIKIKIIIWDKNYPDLKQEETVIVNKNDMGNFWFSIEPSNSAQYKATITAYDTFVKNEYGYSTVKK